MAGCKPNCCTQPRAAPWGNDVALIKVSRSVRATCFMRGNAPCGVKGVMGYALSARGIFAQAQKCRLYQARPTFPPGRCPGLWATFGLTARPNHLPGVCANWFVFNRRLAAARHSPIKQVCRSLLSPCTNVHINAPLVAPWKRLKYVSSRARNALISP